MTAVKNEQKKHCAEEGSVRRQTVLRFKQKLANCYILSIVLYGAEIGTVLRGDQRELKGFEMWCWRRMERIVWTVRFRNGEVLLRVKEQRKIVRTVKTKEG